jgi:hypothetical protein
MARDVLRRSNLCIFFTWPYIYGCFGNLSKTLREENNYILAYLMGAFMISLERLFILQLIQKIPDFKSWVLGCLKDGPKTLAGRTNMHMFRFFVDLLGWLVMQYKVSPINPIWSSINGPLIRLWKVNLDGSPKLPIKIPSPILYHPIWGNDALRLMGKKSL